MEDRVERWGSIKVLFKAPGISVALITVHPHQSTPILGGLAVCKHWVWPDNRYRKVPLGEKHWLVNTSTEEMKVIEVQTSQTNR